MIRIITMPIAQPDPSLVAVMLEADRLAVAKRRWRGTANDGSEFGFELSAPLQHGQTFYQDERHRYVLQQHPEPVIEIALDLAPSAAAGIGWAIGNLHLELCAEPARLLAPDEPAVRQLLGRLQVPFRSTIAHFRPGRFARGAQTPHELGPGHRH